MRLTKLVKPVVIAAAILITVIFVVTDSRNRNGNVPFNGYMKVDGERLNVYESEEHYYAFLPSYVSVDDVKYYGVPKDVRDNLEMMCSSSVATIYIDTSSGNLDSIYADKEYSEPSSVRVVTSQGEKDYTGTATLSGRGNYSWSNWDKKSFSLKLEHKGDILGLGNGKKYALIANASDATLLRNDIGRYIESELGVPYAHRGVYVDLYINGDYMGNYYLADKPDIGEDRIDITDMEETMDRMYGDVNVESMDVYETPLLKGWNLPSDVDDITGGYLLEQEFSERYELEYSSIGSGATTDGGEHFVVVSPKYCTKSQINYLSDYLNKLEKVIMTEDSDRLQDCIDVESFACRYLAEEMMKNNDSGISSDYFYKDSDDVDGRLYAAPGWDYDMSLGNYLDWMNYYTQDGTGLTYLHAYDTASEWWPQLYNHKDFRERVIVLYNECGDDIYAKIAGEYMDDMCTLLEASAAMDYVRWKYMYEADGVTNRGEEYEKLINFVNERRQYLSGVWNIE